VPRSLPPSLIAFEHRNFRLLWASLLVSFTGSTLQTAALLWHVSLLVPADRRGLALGFVGVARLLPIVAFSLVSGVVADAWDRRRVMLVTQSSAALVAATLAALTFRGLDSTGPLYALAALGAAAAAFDQPARQALVPSLVPRDRLPNAISLLAIVLQTASVAGPALGGFVIAGAGVGWAYALNSLSFLVVVAALLMMRDVPRQERAVDGASGALSVHAALEGLRFVFRAPMIRSTMLLDFFATLFSSATALLPIFAQDILGVGARGYGWLYAAPATGALMASATMVPMSGRIERRGRTLLWAVAAYGLATIVFGFSRSFPLTFLCLAATGFADSVSAILRNIIRQLQTPDQLRGRMTSVNMIFYMGGPQLGELEAGLVAHWMGAPFSVVSGGVGCLLATAWIAAATPELRRYTSASDRRER
jgi:MFS family permease